MLQSLVVIVTVTHDHKGENIYFLAIVHVSLSRRRQAAMQVDPSIQPTFLDSDTRQLSPSNPCRRVRLQQLCPRKHSGEQQPCGGQLGELILAESAQSKIRGKVYQRVSLCIYATVGIADPH